MIGNPQYVVLLYDRLGCRIGIRPESGEVRHAFPVRRYGTGQTWNIAIGGFRKWAEIGISQRTEFAVEVSEGLLVIRLKQDKEPGPFEEFIYKSVALSHLSPNVAISRNGHMTLNHAAKELLGPNDRVILLYNRSLSCIGLRPAREDERHARPVRKASTQRTWAISAAGFLKAFDIEHPEGRSYEPTIRDGILLVDLNRPKAPRPRRASVE
jgi:hypothetical protein